MSHPHSLGRALSALALCSTLALPAIAQDCATIELDNVRPQQGQIMVAVYNSAESYGKKPFATLRVPAGDSKMRFDVCGLAGAEVMVTLFQDLDSDGKMGRNLLGMPTEPWGASGKPGQFGPSWETSRVPLDGRAIAVKLSA
jgi:uncharacterized protein (DUF2141 family)